MITLASSGGLVETKGGQEVLRSAGASGKGDVAALERGSTGRNASQKSSFPFKGQNVHL